jgi:hypothetical protein
MLFIKCAKPTQTSSLPPSSSLLDHAAQHHGHGSDGNSNSDVIVGRSSSYIICPAIMSCTTKIDPSRKRSRKSSKNPSNNHKDDDRKSCYKNVLFHERKSSGRPGSPHRYFENSYDVSFQDCVEDDVSSSLSSSSATTSDVTEADADASKVTPGNTDDKNDQSIKAPSKNESSGNQVVHRHVNGLCIITAGNILQTILQQNSISNSHSDGNNSTTQQHHQEAEIVSIKYLVKVDPDAQSAKGKLRAKNKKRKKTKKTDNNNNTDSCQAQQQQHANNCGEVTPTDALCEVTLTNGDKVTLKCCVQGTVIELNHRLTSDRARELSSCVDVDGNSSNSKGDVDGNGNASLLLTDPLLDGYLAVIMPNRGTNLPTL